MAIPGFSRFSVLLAGDAEADLDALEATLAPARGRILQARGIGLACAALRRREYAAAVADVTTVDEALAVIRAAGRTRPTTPVVCLLPADYPLESAVGAEMLRGRAFAVRRHPLTADDLLSLLADAVASPRVIAGVAEDEDWEEEGVA